MNLRKLLYIQVHRGHFIGRVHGNSVPIRRECSGLNHPRTLAGDFHAIRADLGRMVKDLSTPAMRILKPFALVHLVPNVEGGYTNIELRSFKEAVEGAGAHMGFLYDDKDEPLTSSQVDEVFRALG